MNIKDLELLLQKTWRKDSCYPKNQKEWSPTKPAFGQCAVTVLIIQDYFGGELLFCKHNNHYWNRLPDGEEIDLTRSQFNETITICLDEIRSRQHVLESEYAKKASTLERYTLLKHRIERLLMKKKAPTKCLYLMSSNAEMEYTLDILETLAIPFGTVHHFRYQLSLLDDELKTVLSEKGGIEKQLGNIEVIICYLYQETIDDRWTWVTLYPIRIGELVGAYKTGDSEQDVAHFYFKVGNYIKHNSRIDYNKVIKGFAGINWEKKYAFFGGFLKQEYIAKLNENRSAFHMICESFDQSHFKSPEQNGKNYYPLFCFIDGLISKRGKVIAPKYCKFSYGSYYELGEGGTYYFEFMTYTPRSQKPPKATIKLLTDAKYYSTPSEYSIAITSRYNAESFTLISSPLEQTLWTIISFKIDMGESVGDMLPLNLPIYFNIKIKRKLIFRMIDCILVNGGFTVGTGSLALKAALPIWSWWYWFTIGGYIAWLIGIIIIRLWKG